MSLRIVPLGGLGEIGMNCMAIEFGPPDRGPIVIVDCGVTFPSEPFGVELFHPRLSYLEARRERIAGLFVTHGHEDHIGAIPYALRALGNDLPIYGPRYALGLIDKRLQEHPEVRAKAIFPSDTGRVITLRHAGSVVEVEPITVTHSIVDATALAIRHDRDLVVHTGDFKIDSELDGIACDEARFRELGAEGVTLLLSDSTNVDSDGPSRTEAEVERSLEKIIRSSRERVVVSMFASNVHRLGALARIARATGRKLAFLGRSVHTHVRVANDTGFLKLPPDLVTALDDVPRMPRNQVLIVSTGSQAEPRAGLSRLALDDHPVVRLEPGDTVILSARAIPGGEVAVMRMVADLYRRGCFVHLPVVQPSIHASGHAPRSEQIAMMNWTQPASFLPVHGNRHHLERHASVAREQGISDVLVIENGEIASRDHAGLVKSGVAPFGKIPVAHGIEIPEAMIRERAALAEAGAICISAVVDSAGRPIEVRLAARGILDETTQWDALVDVRAAVEETLATHPWTHVPTLDDVREVARLAARRAAARHLGHKPVAIALVHRG